ncbi:MAG TPA: DUF881 domain-containing protein [bacterium]|jgi:uncharacterized protein YlxW (UPF0749 family)
MRPRLFRWQWVLAVFALAIGFLLITQLRAGRAIREETALPTLRVRDLAVLVQQQGDALRSLQSEVDQLQKTLSEYETAVAEGRSAAETLERDVAFYHLVLGLAPIRGPGVVVRLREQGGPGGIVDLGVQAQDLSGLINELRSGGAEGIAVNGRRLAATTGFRQDEQGILMGALRLRGPYEIAAIGDPRALTATLNLRGGFVEGLRSVGLSVQISEQGEITLPAYRGPMKFRYAQPTQP